METLACSSASWDDMQVVRFVYAGIKHVLCLVALVVMVILAIFVRTDSAAE